MITRRRGPQKINRSLVDPILSVLAEACVGVYAKAYKPDLDAAMSRASLGVTMGSPD